MVRAIIKITDKDNKDYISITFGLTKEDITDVSNYKSFLINHKFVVAEKIEILSFVKNRPSITYYNNMASYFAKKHNAEANLVKVN